MPTRLPSLWLFFWFLFYLEADPARDGFYNRKSIQQFTTQRHRCVDVCTCQTLKPGRTREKMGLSVLICKQRTQSSHFVGHLGELNEMTRV